MTDLEASQNKTLASIPAEALPLRTLLKDI